MQIVEGREQLNGCCRERGMLREGEQSRASASRDKFPRRPTTRRTRATPGQQLGHDRFELAQEPCSLCRRRSVRALAKDVAEGRTPAITDADSEATVLSPDSPRSLGRGGRERGPEVSRGNSPC